MDISKGSTFTNTVTASLLHQLVENMSITNIEQSDMKANYGLVFRGSSAPSDTDALWYDTSEKRLKFYNGSAWQSVINNSNFMDGCWITNKSAAAEIDVGIGSVMINGKLRTNTSIISTNPPVDPGVNDFLDVWFLADSQGEGFTVSFVDSGVTPGTTSNPGTNGVLAGSIIHHSSGNYGRHIINYRPDGVYGWNSRIGDDTATIEETVHHGATFPNYPAWASVNLLGKDPTQPAYIWAINSAINYPVIAYPEDITTTNFLFRATIQSGQTFSSSNYYGYTYKVLGNYTVGA